MELKEKIKQNVPPLGLFELDDDGMILYYRADEKDNPKIPTSDLVGHNLIKDFTALAQAAEFRDHLNNFRQSRAPADSFHLNFPLEDGWLKVKVLLAHIREQSENGAADSTLVHIRKI